MRRRHTTKRWRGNLSILAKREQRSGRGRDRRGQQNAPTRATPTTGRSGRANQMQLLQLLFALYFTRHRWQRPKRVLQQQQKRMQMSVVRVGKLAYLKWYGRVVDERRCFGLGETLEETLGQRHQTIGSHRYGLFKNNLLQLERVYFSVGVELLQAHVGEFVTRFEIDLVKRSYRVI